MSVNYVTNDKATNPLTYINQSGTPNRSKGDYGSILGDTLVAGTVTANQWYTIADLSVPREATLLLSSTGGANTVTVESSVDGTNWYVSSHPYTGSPSVVTLSDATDPTNPATNGSAVIRFEPTQYFRVKFSAATNVRAQYVLKF